MANRSPLPEAWNVPQVFRNRVRESVGRQRAMSAEGHLLLVLHEPPKPDEPARCARFFWRAPDGAWQSSTLGPGIGALQKHLAEYSEIVHKLDKAEDHAELADDYFRLLKQIAPLCRAARHVHDTLQEARQMVSEDQDLIVCRDQAYQIHRAAELVQGDCKIGLDCAIARRAEEEAESSRKMALSAHRLNVLAAIFFPIVTISSILGMNLGRGLEEEMFAQWFFWLVLLGGIISGFFLQAAIVEKPGRPGTAHANKRAQARLERRAGDRRR